MEKEILRNKLFNQFFIETDGIPLKDFLNNLKPIIELYQTFNDILNKNIIDYRFYFKINKVKKINYQGKDYLVISEIHQNYVVIDLERKKSLTAEEVQFLHNEDIFVENFGERKGMSRYYNFLKYTGDVSELIKFYQENEVHLSLPTIIIVKKIINDAWVCLFIDLANNDVQLGFRAKDQYLYESLFLDINLKPKSLQDAGSKMSLEQMNEFFSKIGDCIIPQQVLERYQIIDENIVRQRKF